MAIRREELLLLLGVGVGVKVDEVEGEAWMTFTVVVEVAAAAAAPLSLASACTAAMARGATNATRRVLGKYIFESFVCFFVVDQICRRFFFC